MTTTCLDCAMLRSAYLGHLAHCDQGEGVPPPTTPYLGHPPTTDHDPVHAPAHYRHHPSGIECITITEHMSFCLGNVIKYVTRYKLKGGVEDLKKAEQYLKWLIELEVRNALDGAILDISRQVRDAHPVPH